MKQIFHILTVPSDITGGQQKIVEIQYEGRCFRWGYREEADVFHFIDMVPFIPREDLDKIDPK